MKFKFLSLLLIPVLLLGCANDGQYRTYDPSSCITTNSQLNSCTDEQASVNRSRLFQQCKELGGTPQMRLFAARAVVGANCLMPNGQIRDLYAEKFQRDTGRELSQ